MAARHEEAYHHVCGYTLTLGDPAFIHQHVVDAWAAQTASPGDKPIGLTFALAGLCLLNEKGFSGRQVQQAHMAMARRKQPWPGFVYPEHRGAVTAADVLLAPAGLARDRAIYEWCASVWAAWRGSHEAVAQMLADLGIV